MLWYTFFSQLFSIRLHRVNAISRNATRTCTASCSKSLFRKRALPFCISKQTYQLQNLSRNFQNVGYRRQDIHKIKTHKEDKLDQHTPKLVISHASRFLELQKKKKTPWYQRCVVVACLLFIQYFTSQNTRSAAVFTINIYRLVGFISMDQIHFWRISIPLWSAFLSSSDKFSKFRRIYKEK